MSWIWKGIQLLDVDNKKKKWTNEMCGWVGKMVWMDVCVSEWVSILQKPIYSADGPCEDYRYVIRYTDKTNEIKYMAKIQYSILPFGIESVSYFVVVVLALFPSLMSQCVNVSVYVCALNWTYHHCFHWHTVHFPFSISSLSLSLSFSSCSMFEKENKWVFLRSGLQASISFVRCSCTAPQHFYDMVHSL